MKGAINIFMSGGDPHQILAAEPGDHRAPPDGAGRMEARRIHVPRENDRKVIGNPVENDVARGEIG